MLIGEVLVDELDGSSEHRRRIVVLWVVALVVSIALASSAGSNFHNDFSLPGTDAQRATDLLSSHFPSQAGDSDQIVFNTGDFGQS